MAEFSRESLSEERASARMKKKSWGGKWLVVVIILLVLLFGSFFYQFFVAKKKAKQYFAVSLDSGQIYFGRLTRTTANTVTLKNVYFIQVQPAEEKDKQPQLSLQSILTTLPQPKDEIMLFKQAIISIMPLRDDSQVAQFIKQQQLISSGAIPPLPMQQQAQQQPAPAPVPQPQVPAPQETPQK
ncbi:MAG: hypothetical protein HYW78_02800 [Parcubacteria group bacterium]|nr:hypothetical protein [Parcubacteria group bacterium]